jgi:hypothetical protein
VIDAEHDLLFIPGENVGYSAHEVWTLSEGGARRFDGV